MEDVPRERSYGILGFRVLVQVTIGFVIEVIDVAHQHDVYVSTEDWAKNLLLKDPSAFKEHVEECKSLGFDTIELNVGSLGVPEETLLRLVRLIKSGGLKVKPLFEVKVNESEIPTGDRTFRAYVVPRPRSSGMLCTLS
ncbi:protein HEAT-STRESS-ASSOCIATED 32 [Rosa chinensis]|uniref:protein HEAT-STRESS-ASSOCIATED 32 n=1 Tax=Rosa chinensis TaxID=74649 RepID=UPI000D094D3F|nr:protein HEAT-STRESS-ASSOCIATED 32 [Rosa chinensis]